MQEKDQRRELGKKVSREIVEGVVDQRVRGLRGEGLNPRQCAYKGKSSRQKLKSQIQLLFANKSMSYCETTPRNLER